MAVKEGKMVKFLRHVVLLVCLVFLLNPTKHIMLFKGMFREPVIHVFIDEASFAAMQQLVHLLQLPQEDIKIVYWERLFQQQNNLHFFQKNVITERSLADMIKALSGLVQLYPNSDFEFHFNYKHTGWNVMEAMGYVPRERIKMLHMYEDSATHMYRFKYSLSGTEWIQRNVQTIKETLSQKKQRYYFPYLNTLPELFPVTFHVTYLDKLQKDSRFKKLFEIPNIRWKNVDFKEMAKTLDEAVKKKIYHVLQLDIDDIRNKLKDKPMGLLFLTTRKNEGTDAVATKLSQAVTDNMEKHGTVWFVKNHPLLGNYIPREDVYLIPSHIPSEVLTIADLPIKYAAGDGTSAFFTVEAEIIAYIKHNGSYYNTLMDFGLLKAKNILK